MSCSILELVKQAKDAGLGPDDISLLVAKEEEREARKENREIRKLELEREEAEKKRAEADKQREHELTLARLKSGDSKHKVPETFPGLKLPKFQEGKDEIDDFLRRFERLAEIHDWDQEAYHIYLGTLLSGKALKVYVSLPDAVLKSYDILKDSLLKAYAVDAEFYRKRFREGKVKDNETYGQLATRMRQDLDNWLRIRNIGKDSDSICNFLVEDQLVSNCPHDLKMFLKERTYDSLVSLTQSAERFRSAHRSARARISSKHEEGDSPKPVLKCHNCHQPGHIKPNCPEFKKAPKSKHLNKINSVQNFGVSAPSAVTDEGILFGKPAKILLDTGCSTILVKDSLVPPSVKRGKLVKLYDYLGVDRSFPKVRCFINCKFLKGWVEAVAAPIKFADVLIGTVPGVKLPPEQPSGKASLTEEGTVDVVMGVETRAQKRRNTKSPNELDIPEVPAGDITKSVLMNAQTDCPSLESIRKLAASQTVVTVKNRSVKYELVSGLLYRVCTESKKEHEVGMKQLVVPRAMRQAIMSTAHDSSLAGHFSHRKTADKIFLKFFWPGAGADIKRFCRSCHQCQKSSPKGNVRKAPLVPMPIISEPFSRVAIDLVGPLTPSSQGHRYILTLIDCATRFPEAIPLKNIDTVTVAESLVGIFSRVGIPSEILSDRGTQFKSDLMAEVNRLLSIRALFTSPYHACCNGIVERFHAVLKAMLKKLCLDKPRDWDRYLPSVLFAYREIPNDTLKFSPFELLYGRRVRGPLCVLHDLWTKTELDDTVKTTYQYVLDLRSRLEDSAMIASANAAVNSKLYKTYFDRKAKSRVLAEGDEVLVLLPSSNNKLTMQWKGPYSVVKRHVNGVDYHVKTHGKVKLYHINMLKKYVRRDSEPATKPAICQACIIDDTDVPSDVCDVEVVNYPVQGKVNINHKLSPKQKSEINDLIVSFSDVFSDLPGCTSTVSHKIYLTSEIPVHRKPYPVPHHLQTHFDEEVANMTKLGIIEPSTSPYCSPSVLVRKADNTWRFCVDYRALNDASFFDAEPMPRMDEALGNFLGDKYFTEIDLCKGYWQIPLCDESKPLTAFATKQGLMQFTRMPFGLKTACASFIRLMRKVLIGLKNTECYFDNIVVHNANWSAHLSDVKALLQRLREHGLTAGPSKCFMGYHDIKYLGFSLGNNSLSPLADKISAVMNMPLPQTKKQLRSFLSSVSFYRKFIPNLSDLIAPIQELLKKYSSNTLKWTNLQKDRMNLLKTKLSNPPILTLPDYSKVFYLRTDASDTGLGAVLLQSVDGILKPVAYASRSLLDREKRYAVIERECLSIVWAVEKFKNYLYGKEFILQTDQQPLTYLRNMRNGNNKLMRWCLSLQAYSFSLDYIKGSHNVGADFLSRGAVQYNPAV